MEKRKLITVEEIDELFKEHEKRQELLRVDMDNCKQYECKTAIIKVLNYNAELMFGLEIIKSKLLDKL